jgi:DNA mismatch endonuclease (patch repair protein)
MQGNRGRDTRPELALRQALWHRGLRYRVNVRPVPGLRARADIVFTKHRLAVMVDGCFWHSCPTHKTKPMSNSEWWAKKLEYIRARDVVVNQSLAAEGWTVLRIWEHESPNSAVTRVEEAITQSQTHGQFRN